MTLDKETLVNKQTGLVNKTELADTVVVGIAGRLVANDMFGPIIEDEDNLGFRMVFLTKAGERSDILINGVFAEGIGRHHVLKGVNGEVNVGGRRKVDSLGAIDARIEAKIGIGFLVLEIPFEGGENINDIEIERGEGVAFFKDNFPEN